MLLKRIIKPMLVLLNRSVKLVLLVLDTVIKSNVSADKLA